MTDYETLLKREEKAVFAMRDLYRRHGYAGYKMSRFEEYDLYAENKDFLVSDSVITFTDSDGRLMALKPDVTLSIVRNYKEEKGIEKVCYSENVYRRSGSTHAFSEIMQVGLEYLGQVDLYAMGEVVSLACRSLATISDAYILNLSHMGLIAAVLEHIGATAANQAALLPYLREKNRHGAEAFCIDAGLDAAPVLKLISLHGTPETVLPALRAAFAFPEAGAAISELEALCAVLRVENCLDRVQLDFSSINDLKYYNGVVFQGFVNGIPSEVLSGGRYDNLMTRMKKRAGAIGFAVYLDELERLDGAATDYDGDVLLLYRETDDPARVAATVEKLTAAGTRVLAATEKPEKMRFAACITLQPEENADE